MGKKKTHEEYVEELAIKNQSIKVIGEYVDSNTKIMHHCLKHDVYWETTPSRVLHGCGCEMCRKEKFYTIRTKTHEQYVEEVRLTNPDIEVLEKYVSATTPIKHYCKKHNIEWNVLPDSILRGHGCKECGKEKIGDKNKKDHNKYVEELKNVIKKVEVIDTYIDSNTPILHRCLVDGYKWYTRPANVLSGKGCPKCANIIRKTNEKYIKEISLINPDIEVLEKYINANTPILHKCKKHNVNWKVSPRSILRGCGCIECGKEKLSIRKTKSHEQYVEELGKINPNIVIIGDYVGANTPILHRCLIDGNEWNVSPAHTLSGNGCPQCNESKGERKIRLWLESQHIAYEIQKSFEDCRDIKPLPFDFLSPYI